MYHNTLSDNNIVLNAALKINTFPRMDVLRQRIAFESKVNHSIPDVWTIGHCNKRLDRWGFQRYVEEVDETTKR